MLELSASRPRTPAPLDRVATWFRRRRWFTLFVIVPTVAMALYQGFVASDVYISESRFVIKSPSQKQAQLSGIASLIQTTGLSGGQEQTNEVMDYVRSRNALADVARRMDVAAVFSSPAADVLSRYPLPFTPERFENLYKYYGKMVDTRLDHDTNTAVLTTKAFTPDDAHALNARLLDLSEELVNKLNVRAQGKAIAETQHYLADAQARLLAARMRLREYRNTSELLDPAKQATGVLEVSNVLVGQQAALRAQLQAMQRAAPRNPSILALRSRIAAVGVQIDAQNGRAVGTGGGIASKLSQYENLAVEQEFATQMVNAAGSNLEQARAEAQKQQFYLERVVEPNRPDVALLPRRIQSVFFVFATALCVYLIGWMLIVGILEHAPDS
ncbi:capsule biosynthesis protein [Sphingomonas bacterium]|uniref:capsule biosynthesis protein n=1 Tax=Sphingomonas bacterium TaxID=1895847 RepID=UPI001575C2A6|nr:capsule biosynthesis protein [Sphingomonas bacterium]